MAIPGRDPEQVRQDLTDQLRSFQRALEISKEEAKHWKKVATERLLSFFQAVKPEEDDLVLFRIPVGNMPAHEIDDYIAEFANHLNDKRTDGGFLPFEVMWLPYRTDGTGPSVQLLHPKNDDILIIKIPVGNVSADEAKRIINDTKSKFGIRHPDISHVIWLPKRDSWQMDFSLISESDMEAMGWVRK